MFALVLQTVAKVLPGSCEDFKVDSSRWLQVIAMPTLRYSSWSVETLFVVAMVLHTTKTVLLWGCYVLLVCR